MTKDEAFILARSEALARAWLRNSLRVRRLLATDHVERRGTIVVVGAGPSLDVEAVRDAQREGAAVWCVNTALPALAVAGIVPEVCVTRETVDVSSHLAHPHHMLLADIGARPESIPDRAVWVVPQTASLWDVAGALGAEMVDLGPSAVTMAIALASRYALRVELHGVDCCYSGDGDTYHPRAAFGHRTAHWADDALDEAGHAKHMRVNYAGPGHDAKRAAHASAGITAPLAAEAVHPVAQRIGDRMHFATSDLIEQRRWMEAYADGNVCDGVQYVDASNGARKTHWIDIEKAGPRPLERPSLAVHEVDAVAREAVRAAIAAEAEYLATVAVNVVHPDGDPGAVPVRPAGIARSLCAADMLRIRSAGSSLREQLRAQYAAWARAADEVAAAVGLELTAARDYEAAIALGREKPAQSVALASLAVSLHQAADGFRRVAGAAMAFETASDALANVVQRAIIMDVVIE